MSLNIKAVEERYGVKYIGFYDLPRIDRVHVFFQPNPRTDLGHTNYMGMRVRYGNDPDALPDLSVCNAVSILSAEYPAYRFEDGSYICSRYRHDYVVKNGVELDGGLSYVHCNTEPNGHVVIRGSEEVFVERSPTSGS